MPQRFSISVFRRDLKGDKGDKGDTGNAGAPGVGVPVGGTAGQVLAKIDETNYNTEWVNVSGDYLPLAGGTMDANATIGLTDGTNYTSTLSANGLSGLYNNGDLFNFNLNYGSLNFTQNGYATDYGLGGINKQYDGDGYSFNLTGDGILGGFGDNSWGLSASDVHGVDGNNTGLNWSFGLNGLQFADTTVQTTAGLPLTGGTMTGSLSVYDPTAGPIEVLLEAGNDLLITNHTTGNTIVVSPDNIIFPDSTVQTTAGLPLTGGTMASGANINFSGFDGDGNLVTATYNLNGILRNDSFYTNNNFGFQLDGNLVGGWNIDPDHYFSLSMNGVSAGTGNGNLAWSFGLNGLQFADTTVQTSAFIPADYLSTASAVANYQTISGMSAYLTTSSASATYFLKPAGTTGQYIRGDGSLATYSTGDKYLTTSTTSLTISNGAKTLTVGTGLSYSTQQDVTIAYNSSNHMHATVTSYNSGTGVMVCDVYNKTGSGTYASWTVNVGGVAGGSYLQIANNLSDLNSASTARTNLGLGTMATEPASSYQTVAGMSSYLSTASASSTYQTLAGMSAYLSTASAIANYQTISGMSAYLSTASASTTYIPQSNYATTTQAQAGTSTSAVISASTFLDGKFFAGGKYVTQIIWSTATSGTGAVANAQNANVRGCIAPTTATGYGLNYGKLENVARGQAFGYGFDWSKRIVFGLRINRNVASPDANSVFRFSIGKASATPGDLSERGFMIRVAGTSAMQMLVHNGTSLTTTTSSYTPSNSTAYDVVGVSDGSGNATLYVNGSSVATSTGAATAGVASGGYFMFECQNTTTIPSGAMNVYISDFFVNSNV
jgi:hypothetical protein